MASRVPFLVRFGYLGHRFHGLQPQKDVVTAGGALLARLCDASGGRRPRGLAFAARTDTGVHCLSNLATCFFHPQELPDPAGFAAALARPRDDGLFGVQPHLVGPKVHARGASAGKRYRYYVDDTCPPERIGPEIRASKKRDPAYGLYSWRIHPPLDVERMRAAADLLVGTHDYSAFRAAGCTAGTPVKTLSYLRVRGPLPLHGGPGRRFIIELVGDAFLRKMVRNLVGTLVEVGTGWREVEDVARVLASRSRKEAGLTAPARGLTLVRVGCTWPEDGSGLLPELRPPESWRREPHSGSRRASGASRCF